MHRAAKSVMSFFTDPPTWDQLRNRMSTRLVQSTIIIPIIGYIILFNAELQNYFQLFGEAKPNGVSWRLFCMYFGFCSVALSAIIYNQKCPEIIRHHGAAYLFVRNEFEIMHQARLSFFENSLADAGNREFRNLRLSSAGSKVIKDTMRDYFVMMKSARYGVRLFVQLTYWSGVALLAVPSGYVFWKVLTKLPIY